MGAPPSHLIVRPSTEDDVPAMVAIYSHHIARGMEGVDIPPVLHDDIRKRRKTMLKRRLPHLAAELDGVVVGYAYAVPFRKRPAYRYTVKHSIYVHHAHMQSGIGGRLMEGLISACGAAGYRQMIGYIDGANVASMKLHERYGFVRVGFLPSVGFKFGHWTDSVMMQRPLGAGNATPPDDPVGSMAPPEFD